MRTKGEVALAGRSGQKRSDVNRILIIGATSAVASSVARSYSLQPGNRLYLLARNPEKLNALSEELGRAVVGRESLDFNDCARNQPAIERAFLVLGGIDLVLIAHGALGDQELSERDFHEAQQTILTNYTSVISQLIVLGNLLERQGSGHLAVITSVAGDRGRPRNYTYASAKAGVTTYLQGLRARLWPKVRVHTIKLGPVDTPMTVDHKKTAVFISSEQAARGIIRAIARGEQEAYVPSFWRPIMGVVRALPQPVFQRLKFLSER